MADERESKELQSGTLVIGLGRFGSAVAVTQDQLGYEILAVEKNPARVQAFAGRFPLVEADATSKDALEQLGAREFRSAVVGVGSSLEAAVLITANLVDMGISSIWVKATSSQHGRILRRAQLHDGETILLHLDVVDHAASHQVRCSLTRVKIGVHDVVGADAPQDAAVFRRGRLDPDG